MLFVVSYIHCAAHLIFLFLLVCGDAFENGGALVSTGCDMTCVGNRDEICGGSARLSVYNNTAVPDNTGVATPPTLVQEYGVWTSLGCWKFVTESFILHRILCLTFDFF
jgi:hypothetical protein